MHVKPEASHESPLPMNIQLRTARSEDVDTISAIKRLAWPQEDCSPAQVAAALAAPAHQTHLVEIEGRVAGFVDGFLTCDAAGLQRWEVDLLAVHPHWRGRGLGSRLVAANTQSGKQAGAALVRSLIHVDNYASAGAFSNSGYRPQPGEYTLMVLTQTSGTASGCRPHAQPRLRPADSQTALDQPYLVPVTTINYSGLWQESRFTAQGFAAACQALIESDCHLVGAPTPIADSAALSAAAAAGFEAVGNYRWWTWFGV